ncbi:MAG: 50S ribosomal protein L20 [Patescibacteria group bacterium]
MTRVKRGTIAMKKRRSMLKRTKGFRNARSTKQKQAREALFHAGKYAFAHRKDKKADFRGLWQTQISAAVRPHGISYSKFMGILKKKNILLNRKMLANIAELHPQAFERIVAEVQG